MEKEERRIFEDFFNSKSIRGRYYLEFPLGWERILAEAQEIVQEKALEVAVFNEDFWKRLLLSRLKWADVLCVESPKLATEEPIILGKGIIKNLKHDVSKGWRFLKNSFEKIFSIGRVWIIEVKRTLNATAIGQVLIYESIFDEDFNRRAFKGIICSAARPELREACEKNNIQVWEVKSRLHRYIF